MTASNGDKAGVEQLVIEQIDRDAAANFDLYVTGGSLRTSEIVELSFAFARHAQAAKLEGIRIGLEAGADKTLDYGASNAAIANGILAIDPASLIGGGER